jgi:hypothetical protein
MRGAQHYVVPQLGDPSNQPQTGSVCCSHNTHYNPPSDYPWSGYAISRYNNGWTNLKWNEAFAEWVVPNGHTYCQDGTGASFDSPWVGIGGDSWDGYAPYLIQAGSDTTNHYPSPTAHFFWEDFPTNKQQPVSYPTVSIGDDVYVDVHYTGRSSSSFYYQDFTTGLYTTVQGSTTGVDQSSVEFINEDQPSNWDFVNFGTVPFEWQQAFGTWGSNNQYTIQKGLNDNVTLSQFTAYKLGGDTSNHLVAWPTGVDGNGNFTDYATANDGC